MKLRCFLMLFAMFLVSGCLTNDTPSLDPSQMVDNNISYDEAVGKIYTTKELKKIYESPFSSYVRSDFNNIADFKDVKLIRSFTDGYYTFFKTELYTLFIFMDNNFNITYMYSYPHKPVASITNYQRLIGKSVDSLIEVNPAATLDKHFLTLLDGGMVIVKYSDNVIEKVDEWKYLYPNSSLYFEYILPDLPIDYQAT